MLLSVGVDTGDGVRSVVRMVGNLAYLINYGGELKVFSGRNSLDLAQVICDHLKMPVVSITAEGNRVVMLSARKVRDRAKPDHIYYITWFDAFRIDDKGLIAEHWDDPDGRGTLFRATTGGVIEVPQHDGSIINIVDIHAEATSEKMAMGHFCDGRASLVIGTLTTLVTLPLSLGLGIAAGTDKVPGIRATLRSGLVHRLVTTEATARALSVAAFTSGTRVSKRKSSASEATCT